MKTLIVLVAFLSISFGYAQQNEDNNLKYEVKLEGLDVTMTFNHEDEIKDFEFEEMKEIFERVEKDDKLSFKLVYEDPTSIKNGKARRSISYKVEGSTNNLEGFFASIQHIKDSALNILKKN